MYCKNCGEEFKSANTVFCTNCNARVGQGNRFCGECGEPINSNTQSNCSRCGVMLNLTKPEEDKSESKNHSTMNNETFQSNSNSTGYNDQTYNQNNSQRYNDNSIRFNDESSELRGKPKSKVIAILVALFFGGFGVHRYYIGRPASATVMLVLSLIGVATLGLLNACVGIWIIVDMFLMGFNTLKPKNGYFK